ncbi:hypothetical protein [Nannocystis sp. SCPEA4]|uniref:hypothetical protein n=1 Tax=Nannocystis sp. SCPEA4 TaxID=2996787 RepID=UPI002270932D|nr:hypothetical protein [Nannocystis sp. SCPEA4]MCY1059799.1 hypothetical protein [Nannocystis sp. SCPEA4]
MSFLARHDVSLNELLVAPLVFRATWPGLAEQPHATAAGMRDLAEFGGHGAGAIRTAMSRLRSSGQIESFECDGVTRYRLGAWGSSIGATVMRRFERPEGYVLAIFSFEAGDARERQLVRDALRSYGFQKLAQNVYINGQIDTAGIEAVVQEHGLAQHLFLFRCPDQADPALDRRLIELFDVKARARVLARFERELHDYLHGSGVSGDEFVRRYFAAGPANYRVTFVDEPALPARCLPPDYPLERLLPYAEPTARQARAIVDYWRRIHA